MSFADPIGPPGVRESVQRLHRLQKQVDSEKEIREKENTYALVAGASIFACVAIISRWFLNSL
ncbi:hypothetical protein SARC_13493 [Sphaeroforma arctica JP610]|uniref:Uncharacterized protein n=1 Tax=Sphaeroforma arctica JP610 TaxID=667725 RepID=A0A0L0FB56_9EUKA|nr:hypothetical protein SARC_13493 [Sphaeroforma arctica JP610]KNC73947.1 hypothetical protein SARC_13493 [Sphaeroforma arctica JP610]|eukprot:XP_014147849.1 hypothetical protein SARC_13493 [Sphaeroforma arctica JP610]